MKKILCLILFGTLLFSCIRDGESGDYFKCEIDGSKFEVEGILAYAVQLGGETSFAVYGLLDQTGESETVYFSIQEDMGTGNYQLGTDKDGHVYYVDDISEFFYTTVTGMGSGSLNISSKTAERVKGTFNVSLYDNLNEKMVSVTDGEFDVAFR